MKLIPKNWEKFQHYKDRCPPWIKLHRDLLNDRVFMSLPTASKALAPLMWMLASESKLPTGEFDGSTEELEFRLRISAKDIESGRKSLIDKGFFVVASGALADCPQVAIPEGETEGETEGEKEVEKEGEKRQKPASQSSFVLPEWINREHWDKWHTCAKRKKATDDQKSLSISKLTKWRDEGMDYATALENAAEGGWQGLFLPKTAVPRAQSESFAERDERAARDRIAEATGSSRGATVIDMNMQRIA